MAMVHAINGQKLRMDHGIVKTPAVVSMPSTECSVFGIVNALMRMDMSLLDCPIPGDASLDFKPRYSPQPMFSTLSLAAPTPAMNAPQAVSAPIPRDLSSDWLHLLTCQRLRSTWTAATLPGQSGEPSSGPPPLLISPMQAVLFTVSSFFFSSTVSLFFWLSIAESVAITSQCPKLNNAHPVVMVDRSQLGK